MPGVWALVPLPDNRQVELARALGELTKRNWKLAGKELLDLNGQRFRRMRSYSYLRLSPQVSDALQQRFGAGIEANNSRPGCLRQQKQRPSRIVITQSDTTNVMFFAMLGIRQAAIYKLVADEVKLLNPSLDFSNPAGALAGGSIILIPQSIPLDPTVLKSLQQQPEKEEEEKEKKLPPSRGGISYGGFAGLKRSNVRGLDTESTGRARATSQGELNLNITAALDIDNGPGLLRAQAHVDRQDFLFNPKSRDGERVESEVPESAVFSSLDIGWGADDQELYLGAHAGQLPLIVLKREEDGSERLKYYTVNAFGPVIGASRGNPYGWSFWVQANPQGYVGSNELDLEPGFEMHLGASRYSSEFTSYITRLRLINVRASEPKFAHDYTTIILEFGVHFY